MNGVRQFLRWIAVLIALATSSSTSAFGMDIGVWKPTSLLGPVSSVAAVEVGPQGDLWAIREYPESVWSLIRSADGGTTWTTVTAGIATPPQYDPPKLLVVDSQNCAWLYTPGWVLSRFSPDGDLLTTVSALSACMVATPDGYVYRITGGLQRISMDGQIRTTQPDLGDAIYVLSVDSKGTLYAVGTYVFRSTDGGLTWETIYKGDHETRLDGIAVGPDGNLFIWTFWLLYRSTDGGKTWTELPLLSEQRLGAIRSLPDGSVGAAYARNLSDEPGRLYGFFRSWNKGNTWEELMAGIPKADYLGCEHVVTYGERIVYAYFRFVEGSSTPSGLYRMVLPARARADKNWLKY